MSASGFITFRGRSQRFWWMGSNGNEMEGGGALYTPCGTALVVQVVSVQFWNEAPGEVRNSNTYLTHIYRTTVSPNLCIAVPK